MTERLKEYMIKGFTMDDERLKNLGGGKYWKELLDRVLASAGKKAALIGEDDWNSIQETLYLMAIPGMTESIIKADNEPITNCLESCEVW